MKRWLALCAMALLPVIGAAQVYQTISKSTDVTAVPQAVGLRCMEQATVAVDWRFKAGASARNLTGAGAVTFYYSAGVTATGSVTLATNGQVSVTLTPAQTATNGTFDYVLTVAGTTTLAVAYGSLEITENPLASAQVTLLTGTSINWGTVTQYLNAVSGPAIPDWSSVSATTNAVGQLVLKIAPGATNALAIGLTNSVYQMATNAADIAAAARDTAATATVYRLATNAADVAAAARDTAATGTVHRLATNEAVAIVDARGYLTAETDPVHSAWLGQDWWDISASFPQGITIGAEQLSLRVNDTLAGLFTTTDSSVYRYSSMCYVDEDSDTRILWDSSNCTLGATNIVRGTQDWYNPTNRTLTYKTNDLLGAVNGSNLVAGTVNSNKLGSDVLGLIAGGTADGGATNIVRGTQDWYNSTNRTLTYKTNDLLGAVNGSNLVAGTVNSNKLGSDVLGLIGTNTAQIASHAGTLASHANTLTALGNEIDADWRQLVANDGLLAWTIARGEAFQNPWYMADGLVESYTNQTGINLVLSSGQVWSVSDDGYYYNYPGGDTTTKLLAHFDGAGSTNIVDSSGNSVPIDNPEGAWCTNDPAVFSESLSLDGVATYVTVADGLIPELAGNDFTLELWIYPTADDGRTLLAKQDAVTTYAPILIYEAGGGTWAFHCTYFGTGWNVASASAGALTVNAWQHLAWSRSGASLYVFNNGMLTNTVSLGANTLWNNDDAWQFGRQANGTAYFPGYIDELRITVGQARYTSNFVTSNVPFSVSAGWNTNMVLYTTNMPAALAPSDILVQHDIQVVQTSTPFTVGRDLIVQATVNDDYTGWSNLAATVDSIGVPTNHVRVMAYNPIANPNSKSNMAIRTILATNDNAALRLNLYNSQYTYK